MMDDKFDDVKKDIAEIEKLLEIATRRKVKDMLTLELRKLTTEASSLESKIKSLVSPTTEASTSRKNKCYQVKINNYAWDQTSKFLKLYVTIPKVQTAPSDNVYCEWTPRSVELHVKSLDNKDHLFTIKNLLADIDPTKSSWKTKTDLVIISLSKVVEGTWSHVTELEKRASDSKKLLPDDADDAGGDPSAGLMKMMKKMYESGDDELKRTIAKAWTEGQMKNTMDH